WDKIGSVFGLYLIVATLIAVTNTYIDAWKFGKFDRNTAYISFFTDAFTTVAIIFILYSAYYILKELIFKLIAEKKSTPRNKNRFITVFLIVAGWVAVLIVF